jgi:hypothetical protein
MATITVPKKEYQQLLDKALRYEYLRQLMERDIFSPPQSQNSKEVVEAFKNTGLYNQAFLKSSKKGLMRSSHFKT